LFICAGRGQLRHGRFKPSAWRFTGNELATATQRFAPAHIVPTMKGTRKSKKVRRAVGAKKSPHIRWRGGGRPITTSLRFWFPTGRWAVAIADRFLTNDHVDAGINLIKGGQGLHGTRQMLLDQEDDPKYNEKKVDPRAAGFRTTHLRRVDQKPAGPLARVVCAKP